MENPIGDKIKYIDENIDIFVYGNEIHVRGVPKEFAHNFDDYGANYEKGNFIIKISPDVQEIVIEHILRIVEEIKMMMIDDILENAPTLQNLPNETLYKIAKYLDKDAIQNIPELNKINLVVRTELFEKLNPKSKYNNFPA